MWGPICFVPIKYLLLRVNNSAAAILKFCNSVNPVNKGIAYPSTLDFHHPPPIAFTNLTVAIKRCAVA